MNEQKNMIMAAALSFLVIVGWTFLQQAYFPPPPPPEPPTATAEGAAPAPGFATVGPAALPRAEALAAAPRLPIRTPRLTGTLSLKGGRIDDLDLATHRVTIDPESPSVTLLSPTATESPYYAIWGWSPTQGQGAVAVPTAETLWSVESGETLAPAAPVTLVWDNGAGLTFRRTFAVDDQFLFTVAQTVENRTGAPVTLAPWAIVARHGMPATLNNWIVHEGAIAELDGVLKEFDYDDILALAPDPAEGGANVERVGVTSNGWLGFTDKYWMAALAGGPEQPFTAVFKATQSAAGPVFQTDLRQPPVTIAPGETGGTQAFLFAGAKEVRVLSAYERDPGIAGFVDAVDWGWFFFLTKPLFWMLAFLRDLVGNMGWAIILLTVVVKTVLFPLAWKSFVAMSRMKKLQPEMEAIKARVGDDRMKMQTEMMELYKREKVNPAAGCLPILVQIPIFFSLYKVIFVSIELRHAPFIGWIRDLSAPDPTTWMNLFGLLPFDRADIPAILTLFSIGVFPLLMGVTMWMQQKLNPAPTDPVQAQVFALMPIMFTFMMGQFESGLVIYWTANNILTFVQQYSIMRSQGVDVDFLGNVKNTFKRRRAAP